MSSEPGAELKSTAEQKAVEAQSLPAFAQFNLLGVKTQVAQLLAMIGRGGFFGEYSRHDISHVNAMLEILEWIIPANSKARMTEADWLMIVLAVYFHDLGLLVTEEEYRSRDSSDFIAFKSGELFQGEHAEDYKHKVDELGDEQAERFYYQEYVRHHHAERVRRWIIGENVPRLGDADAVATELGKLLRPLGELFREDLGMVCESHHADDLDELDKYRLRRAYGNSGAETANLQYAALLIRTVDLLHMAKDRTPSIMYRTINPSDPVSQQEWAKQMGVNRVCSREGRDRDGNPDKDAPRNIIEVHAYFTQPEPFFSLSSFLKFVEAQLKQNATWAALGSKAGSDLEFPWRWIDDRNIETKGFLKHSFAFELDQPRILKLLTGHTLYNDASVVLRELVQNSLDAVRLQKYLDDKTDAKTPIGEVKIHWDSKDKCITVTDTGTGMTQQIIEDHLLKVGSSRYDESKFKEDHPGFVAISRFGIGILSAFMVADEVDIYTCHPDDDQARHLSLRNLLGKYLIRLLDKDLSGQLSGLKPHGTRIQLRLRPSARIDDIAAIAKRWVVVPRCLVTVQIDDDQEESVGFDRVGDALRAEMESSESLRQELENEKWKVLESEINGVEVAFAVKWLPYFHQWSPIVLGSRHVRTFVDSDAEGEDASISESAMFGSCVQGIRVENSSPGFKQPILMLANAKGEHAPKTNVARSGIERGAERRHLWQSVYEVMMQHFIDEFKSMQSERGYTSAHAAQELNYLVRSVRAAAPKEVSLFDRSVNDLPLLLVESDGTRKCISLNDLSMTSQFWTTESPLFSRVEWVLREGAESASLRDLAKLLVVDPPPEGLLVCRSGSIDLFKNETHEIDRIVVSPKSRRVDFRWSTKTNPERWRRLFSREFASRFKTILLRTGTFHRSLDLFDSLVAAHGITIEEQDRVSSIFFKKGGIMFLNEETEFLTTLSNLRENLGRPGNHETEALVASCLGAVFGLSRHGNRQYISSDQLTREEDFEDSLNSIFGLLMNRPLKPAMRDVLKPLMPRLLAAHEQAVAVPPFDPWAWERDRWGSDFD